MSHSNVLPFGATFKKGRALNYKMTAKADSAAEIMLYDIVGDWGVSAAMFQRDLKALGNPKTIDLRVNSEGGDIFQGKAIYTQLAQHSARVVAHVDGIAASAASLICMAGDEIRMADGAFMMIHNAWTVTVGDKRAHQKNTDVLGSIDSTCYETYAARTGQTVDAITAWCNDETWMTATEAVARGFADIKDEPVRVAACLRTELSERYHNAPARLLRPRRAAADDLIAAMVASIR